MAAVAPRTWTVSAAQTALAHGNGDVDADSVYSERGWSHIERRLSDLRRTAARELSPSNPFRSSNPLPPTPPPPPPLPPIRTHSDVTGSWNNNESKYIAEALGAILALAGAVGVCVGLFLLVRFLRSSLLYREMDESEAPRRTTSTVEIEMAPAREPREVVIKEELDEGDDDDDDDDMPELEDVPPPVISIDDVPPAEGAPARAAERVETI